MRVRGDVARSDPHLCIDCGSCVDICPKGAARAVTSSPADLKRFKHSVAIPSMTLYGQFGPEVHPGQVLRALRKVGFDSVFDMSWMCEMLSRATDSYLSEAKPPWPKVSVTCPAIVRLVQIRYPELLPHLVSIETARELAAKLVRRRLEPRHRGLVEVFALHDLIGRGQVAADQVEQALTPGLLEHALDEPAL